MTAQPLTVIRRAGFNVGRSGRLTFGVTRRGQENEPPVVSQDSTSP